MTDPSFVASVLYQLAVNAAASGLGHIATSQIPQGAIGKASAAYRKYIDNVTTVPLIYTNRSIKVHKAYVSVTLSSSLSWSRQRDPAAIETELESFADRALSPSSTTPIEALARSNGLMALLGKAGSGKTTIFRYLSYQLAQGRPLKNKKLLPIFITVRQLSSEREGIVETIVTLLESWGLRDYWRVLYGLLQKGQILIFLDGIDETDDTHRSQLLNEVARLRERFPDLAFAISGRPYSLESALPGFSKWETLPLSFVDRVLFVKKWFEAVDPSKGDELIKSVKDRREMRDLGSTPLLLSMLCALYENEFNLPEMRVELYARSVEGLMGRWDFFRRISRMTPLKGLAIDRRRQLLGWLAFSLFENNLRTFTSSDLVRIGVVKEAALRLRSAPIDEGVLLRSLCEDFGIFVEQAPGRYSFVHLTLQEYLCAAHAVDQRLEMQVLADHGRDEGWYQVVTMLARLLQDASDFLEALVVNLRIASQYDAKLLRGCWHNHPAMAEPTRAKIMRLAAKTIAFSIEANKPGVAYDAGSRELKLFLYGGVSEALRQSLGEYVGFLLSLELPAELREEHWILKSIHGFRGRVYAVKVI